MWSFAVILWRLFVGLHSSDPEESPYKPFLGPELREKIRNVRNKHHIHSGLVMRVVRGCHNTVRASGPDT